MVNVSYYNSSIHNLFSYIVDVSVSIRDLYQKKKLVLVLLVRNMTQRMTEVMVTTEAIRRAKLQSNHHQQQTNIQCFTGWMPFLFLSANQQCQSTKGYNT